MIKNYTKYYFSFLKFVNRYLWSGDAVNVRPAYVRYGATIILLALITLLKLQFFEYLGDRTPFRLYFIGVIIATGFGGIGPGIFASLSSAILSAYFFISPAKGFDIGNNEIILVIIYIMECFLVISLSGAVTRASNRVRKTAERFHALVQNSADVIAVTDASAKVLYCSPAVKKALGYSVKEFRSINGFALIHPDEEQMTKEFFSEVMQSPGIAKSLLHRYQHKNGKFVWIESTIKNMLHDPNVEGLVSNFKNVTDRVELEKQKEDFVGIATHELKTPVTSIKAYAQILLNRFSKDGNAAAVKLIEKMDGQLNKLISLISDLLDITKIEAGRLALNENYYSINDMIKEVVEELQRTTERHTLILNLSTDMQVYGDKERTGQVLTNLISNAIKYSPSASDIDIFSKVENDEVTISVADRGLGIDKDHHAKVFNRFYRVSGPQGDSFPGLGLGLYISHEIVKRQGGRIWVESEKDKGSTFCFTLPVNNKI